MIRRVNTSIQRASTAVGGQASLARIVGVSAPTVNQWATGKRPVPLDRCVAIEKATGGVVTRRELRPDDWRAVWPELAGRCVASMSATDTHA